jgi:hypothetical protein|tara:strand:+ start:1346 stop:1552 length:207 start_codon:yes stop_codon:yes gene_type:complete
MIVGTSKWKVSLDEKQYKKSLLGLEMKELNKLLKNRNSCLNKKKKVFVEMRDIFLKQIEIINGVIEKI